MKEIFSGTIAIILSSFALFLSADLFSESLHDVLREKLAPPMLAQFADALSPIGFMYVVFPIGIGVWYFLLTYEKRRSHSGVGSDSSLIWHIIAVMASLLVVSVSITVSAGFTYLDGHREPSVIQWVGNIIIFSIIVLGISDAIRTRKIPDPKSLNRH